MQQQRRFPNPEGSPNPQGYPKPKGPLNPQGSLTQQLSISSETIGERGGCALVAKFLAEMNIAADVTSNSSVIETEHGGTFTIERGCRILLSGQQPEVVGQLWPKLKEEFGLQCAHFKQESMFSGCIYDYLRDSNCPGATNSSK